MGLSERTELRPSPEQEHYARPIGGGVTAVTTITAITTVTRRGPWRWLPDAHVAEAEPAGRPDLERRRAAGRWRCGAGGIALLPRTTAEH
jgi:hypothetical protein